MPAGVLKLDEFGELAVCAKSGMAAAAATQVGAAGTLGGLELG
jgi:hypothetical protein